jgi:hypothetical protein
MKLDTEIEQQLRDKFVTRAEVECSYISRSEVAKYLWRIAAEVRVVKKYLVEIERRDKTSLEARLAARHLYISVADLLSTIADCIERIEVEGE